MKNIIFFILVSLAVTTETVGQISKFESDVFETSPGKLTIYFIGHGTLMFDFNGKMIHVDPCGQFADYSLLPKADVILVTHEHQDHFDPKAIELISKKNTQIILNGSTFDLLKKGIAMKNGEKKTIDGIEIEAVPAYNITPGREKFHPKGRDNGYVITFGNKRVYVAGDTENIPEMANLKNIDIAFLPMNQPYTMLPEQVADAAGKFHPKILYPYHFGTTEPSLLAKLLATDKNIEVRIKPLN